MSESKIQIENYQKIAWQEAVFRTFDGETLFYRYRKPIKSSKNTLLFLHRGHEHSGRIVPIANKLVAKDQWCFAFDLRGHGLSGGKRAWAEDFQTWVKDLNCFAGHIQNTYGIRTDDTVIVSNSVGSVMAVSWILKYAPNLKGCILGAPAFTIKLYIPLALSSLRLLSKFTNNKFVTSYVRSNLLTRDPVEAKAYDTDPLITKKIGVNVLVTLFDDYRSCAARLKDFETPILLFSAEKDHIVSNRSHDKFFNDIASANKKHIKLDGFKHAIFHELEQEKITQPAKEFIKDCFAKSTEESEIDDIKYLPAVITPPRAHTVTEYENLLNNDSKPKQLFYGVSRYLLTRFGKYSCGVATGLQHGFDSGVSLDYVYTNKVAGSNWLGKLIDKVYLNSTGWKGIRNRKLHLKNALHALTKLLHANNMEPNILDIASGPGRYLFELQQELIQERSQSYDDVKINIQLNLNDNDIASINKAREIAASKNAKNVSFNNLDVFSGIAKETFKQVPNIIIVSGLFELYENNHAVHRVIKNMYELLTDGGYIVYTGQPWHPQMELIGRLLNNRNGQKWTMRRRIQNEMDELITSVGFKKLNTESDKLGIFTVSCAQKGVDNGDRF